MVAEKGGPLAPTDFINADLCLLDYRYEELGIIFHSRYLRNEIEKIGYEGKAFLDGPGTFLEETQEKIVVHKPTEIQDLAELRPLFSFRLPYKVIRKIAVYLDTMLIASLKQDYNV